MKDFAVVGSGIGGSSIAALLSAKGFDVALFEKDSHLGGCSSSFFHKGYMYNTGATTLAGYEEGFIVKEVFDAIGFTPKVIPTDPSIVVIQEGKITPRFRDFELFYESVQENYPHAKNRKFWEMVFEINREFYKYSGHYYANANIFSKIKSLLSFLPLFMRFQKYFRVNAFTFMDDFYGGIALEYFEFLESQILIVAQAPSKDINFFTAALALGYTFNKNHYALGGFSQVFEDMTKHIKDVYKKTEIIKILQQKDHFELHTHQEIFRAKKVILNATVYESGKLFSDEQIQNYYKKYEKLDNHQSSFMLYMTIKSSKKFHSHYQIIEKEPFAHALSRALFVSFSDASDTKIAPEGHYSITASVHTDSRFWQNPLSYQRQKKELHDTLQSLILSKLQIDEDEVVASFSATSKTFKHYINRTQLGGNAITIKNFLPFLPGNDTPIKNLYNVGDTVYAAQGWPGVMLGVKNLQRLLHV